MGDVHRQLIANPKVFSHLPSKHLAEKQPSLSNIEILVSEIFSVASVLAVIVVHLKCVSDFPVMMAVVAAARRRHHNARIQMSLFDLPFVLLLQIKPSSLTVCWSFLITSWLRNATPHAIPSWQQWDEVLAVLGGLSSSSVRTWSSPSEKYGWPYYYFATSTIATWHHESADCSHLLDSDGRVCAVALLALCALRIRCWDGTDRGGEWWAVSVDSLFLNRYSAVPVNLAQFI